MKLLKHQIKFASGYPDKGLIVHEAGTGKTVCACVWLCDGRDADALVICPKQVVQKWRDTLPLWGATATVVSKEDFKKLPIRQWSAIVLDEADEFASPLFTKERSQRSERFYYQMKQYDCPLLLLTATPIRSTPWNLHTLRTYLGDYVDWKAWREEFFSFEDRPYLKWKAWLSKPDWRTSIRTTLEENADIVLLKDCVGDVPPVEHEVVKTRAEKFTPTELTPMGRFVERHRFEQTRKPAQIIDIGKGYRKVLVVAHYVEQVETLKKELSKDRQTFMIHGGVKDQESIIAAAQAADECYLIIQASIGAGFDADTFSCVVFASMSFKVRDYVQMKARVRRIHNLHPVKYYYLLSGACDTRIYDTIQNGKDFVPSEYLADFTSEEEA